MVGNLWKIIKNAVISLFIQGIKLTYFCGSHLAPKYFKVVANSKKLVVIMTHIQTIFILSLYLKEARKGF